MGERAARPGSQGDTSPSKRVRAASPSVAPGFGSKGPNLAPGLAFAATPVAVQGGTVVLRRGVEVPAQTLQLKDEAIEMAASSFATPVSENQLSLIGQILGAMSDMDETHRFLQQFGDPPQPRCTTFDSGNRLLQCNVFIRPNLYGINLFIDGKNLKPVALSVKSHQTPPLDLEVRFEAISTDEDWLRAFNNKRALPPARSFVEIMEAHGPTPQDLWLDTKGKATRKLGEFTEANLQALLRSMASRDDEVGEKVCRCLQMQGSSPATLGELGRDALVHVLLAQTVGADAHLPLNLSDYRWLPPACVSRFVERSIKMDLLSSKYTGHAVRELSNYILTHCAPVGNGRLWHRCFILSRLSHQVDNDAVAEKSAHVPGPRSVTLDRALGLFKSNTSEVKKKLEATRAFCRFEEAWSVVDFPELTQIAELTDEDLVDFGFSKFTRDTIVTEGGCMSWLRSLTLDQRKSMQNPEGLIPVHGAAHPQKLRKKKYEGLDDPLQAYEFAKHLKTEALRESALVAYDFYKKRDSEKKNVNTRPHYFKFLHCLENQSLWEILKKSPAKLSEFQKLSLEEKETAREVLDEDQIKQGAKDRARAIDAFEDLPMRVQTLVVEALPDMNAKSGRALSMTMPHFLKVGSPSSVDYVSPLYTSRRLMELAARQPTAALEAASVRRIETELQKLVHDDDQHYSPGRLTDQGWRPGRSSRLLKAMLVPDDFPEKGSDDPYPAADLQGRRGTEELTYAAREAGGYLKRNFKKSKFQFTPPTMLSMLSLDAMGTVLEDSRLRPTQAVNIEWLERVGTRLLDEGRSQNDVDLALDTMGQWMLYRQCPSNPWSNHVARQLRDHADDLFGFMESVRVDLAKWKELLEKERELLSVERQGQPADDGGNDFLENRIRRVEKQRERLSNLDDPTTWHAFQILHSTWKVPAEPAPTPATPARQGAPAMGAQDAGTSADEDADPPGEHEEYATFEANDQSLDDRAGPAVDDYFDRLGVDLNAVLNWDFN